VVPRWVLAVVVAVVVVAAIDVGVFVGTRGTHSDTADAQPARGADQVVVIDPRTGRIVDRVPVGRSPTVVAAGYGGAWVLNKEDGTVSHIDGRTRRVVSTSQLDVTANDLTIGAGGVWFAGRLRNGTSQALEIAQLERIDPATDAIDRTFDTRTGASVIAAGGGAVWSTGYLGGHVRGAARSDALTGAMRKVDIEIYGDLVAADDRAVYWVASIGDRVARVSTKTGLLTNSLPLATNASLAAGHVPPNPTDVAVGGGAVWISAVDGSVIRLDPHLHGIVASIPACKNALNVAYGEGAVWVACGDGTVVRVDPSTNRADAPIRVGSLPRGIAAGAGEVWVTLN
jgi:outer membrane protein assembly factor BamB